MSRAYIGTSGWNYKHWGNGVFYPRRLPPAKWLEFFAQHFTTVEINNSFYRLPEEAVFDRWRRQTPEGFRFAVKASRFVTHIKRLKEPEEPLDLFFSGARRLENRLGPVLFQLPPQFKADFERLRVFLTVLRKRPSYRRVRCVVEFRNATWLDPRIYELLTQHRVALCFADWRELHVSSPVTADFVYVRRHFGSLNGSYSKRQLDHDVQQIREWLNEGLDVYVYFNNDQNGNAIRNARYIRNRL